MSDWQPGAFPQSGAATTGFPPVTGAVTSAQLHQESLERIKQAEIANYIMNKASVPDSKDQAEAFVVQAVGEVGLSPTASNPSGWENFPVRSAYMGWCWRREYV